MSKKYIVVTRPVTKDDNFQKEINSLGFTVLQIPTIAIRERVLTPKEEMYLQKLPLFDWIVFTSQNGAKLFFTKLSRLHIDSTILQTIRVAAVGPKTAEALEKYHIPATFTPSVFTTKELGHQLPDVKNKKILLARAKLANPVFVQALKKRGARVTALSLYTTEYINTPQKRLAELLGNDYIAGITFTSSSTVKGFLKQIEKLPTKQKIFSLPVFSIGPETSQTLKDSGFRNISTADMYTLDGIIEKIKELLC